MFQMFIIIFFLFCFVYFFFIICNFPIVLGTFWGADMHNTHKYSFYLNVVLAFEAA